jgi:hypothetical protein
MYILRQIIPWFNKPLPKEKHMNHFSQEFLDKLIAEHRLISAAILQLSSKHSDSGYARYVRSHGVDAVDQARKNLYVRKVELEAQIDVLRDYLN